MGLILNLTLYFVDLKKYDGVLNRVDKGDSLEGLIETPEISRKEIIKQSLVKSRTSQMLTDYKLDQSARQALKQSLASKRPY